MWSLYRSQQANATAGDVYTEVPDFTDFGWFHPASTCYLDTVHDLLPQNNEAYLLFIRNHL